MKSKAIERQLRQVLDGTPISVVGSLAYLQPLDYLLRGFKLETSGFNAARLTVECFVMPLFPAQDYLAFMIGGRLGRISGGSARWWTVDVSNPAPTFDEIAGLMVSEGLPFLRRFDTLEAFASAIEDGSVPADSRWGPEAAAYAWIMAGNTARGLAIIDRLLPEFDTGDMAGRLREIRALAIADPVTAEARLAEWAEATKRALKLSGR